MTDLGAELNRILSELPPNEQSRVRAKMVRVLIHRRALLRFPTPAHLSQFHRPDFIQTPMLDVLDRALMMADRGEATRIIVNTPPQEGKTSRLQDGCAWFLMRDPTRRIGFASYEQSIASQSSLEIRRLIETHGTGYRGQKLGIDHVDSLGLMLDPERAQQAFWSLADVPGLKGARPGNVMAVGVGSALTGRPLDVIVIDDPIKDSKQANSKTVRDNVIEWYRSVVLTRLPPKSIVIVVQTRWHEEDLSGWLLAEDKKSDEPEWLHLNVPAQAEDQDDILGRKPGEFLVSARRRTADDWAKKRKAVGTRWWFAMYQGRPTAPEGGTFKRAWFDKNRVAVAPPLKYVITIVDPADNSGDGDEAGIITGGLGHDGHFYLLEDNSGHYTVAQWVRVAIFAMLRNKGAKIGYEQSLSGLGRAIKAQWRVMRRQALALARAREDWKRPGESDEWPEEIMMAVLRDARTQLAEEDTTPEELGLLTEELREMWQYVPKILKLPKPGPPVKRIIAKGDKAYRAEMASVYYENGQVRHVGPFAKLENQMATWLTGQDSPDRMDADVHWVHEMSATATVSEVKRPPKSARTPRQQLPMPKALRSSGVR